MLFSIILPTRNRPELFSTALSSVLAQTCRDYELIIVNDGSSAQHQAKYAELIARADCDRLRYITLTERQKGHGQSYSINTGAMQALGDYLCFLDDDDFWTDPEYLERVRRTIGDRNPPPDLHMSNQAAYAAGVRREGPIWLEGLTPKLADDLSAKDVHEVSVPDLLGVDAFCHLNTLIVRRSLYEEIGGMDEAIRWECDHDLYLRLLDAANVILYSSRFVSHHNIPDRARKDNMTTSLSELERRLYQLRVFDKALIFGRRSEIRKYARRHRRYTLARISRALFEAGDCNVGVHYACASMAAARPVAWLSLVFSWFARPIGKS